MKQSRRDILRLTIPAAMATTFLPIAGRGRAWAHPAEGRRLLTRVLGRTGREVTTFGLAGGNKVMWDLPADEGVEIVVKAVRMGITYLETANAYQQSQLNYGKAFRILNLIPGQPGYDSSLRARLFLATKSHLRTALVRGDAKPVGRSRGGGTVILEDLRRSLSQFFGDGQGGFPDGAYIDLFQIHSLRHESDVDAAFEGYDNPADRSLDRVGALACLVDYRDGTNLTGLNPEHRKYIRHIGITGHENPTAHMYAMRRDTRNELETLLVSINPNDRFAFSHLHNSIPVAAAKGMGMIAMKVFADGVMYGLPRAFASRPGQSVPTVGAPGKLPPSDFLHYALSVPGMSCAIAGIGLIDRSNQPDRDQLVADLAGSQLEQPLAAARMRDIEERTAALHGTDTNFFQRPSSGLVAPETVRAARRAGSKAVDVTWSTAYAGLHPLSRYDVYRRDQRVGSLPYQPQTSEAPFAFADEGAPEGDPGGLYYKIRTVDESGRYADSLSAKVLG